MLTALQLDDDDPTAHPTLHLPNLLRILGPSSLTPYKYVLGQCRILIYTLPPAEAASILCQVATDMAYKHRVGYSTNGGLQRCGRCKEGISVLGW
jgi:hypothetical protein